MTNPDPPEVIEFQSCPTCRGHGKVSLDCVRCYGRGSVNITAIGCPVCGDTYMDLWEHLASNRKRCGDRLLGGYRDQS